MSDDPYEAGPFRCVFDMETPLIRVESLLKGIALIAETMERDHGGLVLCMASLALEQCGAVDELHGELFRLTHPRRERFEQEGWPT